MLRSAFLVTIWNHNNKRVFHMSHITRKLQTKQLSRARVKMGFIAIHKYRKYLVG